jgi:hypothetical protein
MKTPKLFGKESPENPDLTDYSTKEKKEEEQEEEKEGVMCSLSRMCSLYRGERGSYCGGDLKV